MTLVAPWLSGGYFLILDIWGDKWNIITNYQSFHEKAFCTVLFATLACLFFKGLIKRPDQLDSDDSAREILSEFTKMFGVIVQVKIERFREAIPKLKPNSKKFEAITHPTVQLSVISRAAAQFISTSFGINNDEIDITVLRCKNDKEWHYYYNYQKIWRHDGLKNFKDTHKAASTVIETGEPLFIPDKMNSDHYQPGERDSRRKVGSGYFYPVIHRTGSIKIDCVVSIVTYGKQFCEEHEAGSVELTKTILNEICRRFELELSLDAIKTGV